MSSIVDRELEMWTKEPTSLSLSLLSARLSTCLTDTLKLSLNLLKHEENSQLKNPASTLLPSLLRICKKIAFDCKRIKNKNFEKFSN